jgi:hypothetical protein
MNLELDNIKLIQKRIDEQTSVTELIASILNLDIKDKRSIVEHKIPGMQGGVLQDMGREPIVIKFEGIVLGEESKQTLEYIRSKFKSGDPVQLLSDITGIAEINQVLIQDFNFLEEQGFQSQYKYDIVLREYVEPVKEDEPPPDQEKEAEEETEEEAENTEKSVNYITGKIVDTENNPVEEATVKISGDDGEFTLKTDKDGIYKKDDLEPGTYEVTVDLPGYEDIIEKVEIKD